MSTGLVPIERVEVLHPTTPLPSVSRTVQLLNPERIRSVSASVPIVRSPVPLGWSVRFALLVVPRVAAAPPPRLRRVESIPSVLAASIEFRFPAVRVVRPDALIVVSSAAIVIVLEALSSVRAPAPPEERVTAPAPVYALPAAIETPASLVIESALRAS